MLLSTATSRTALAAPASCAHPAPPGNKRSAGAMIVPRLSEFSPGLAIEEYDVLRDGVAPDAQFVGWEVRVGITDGQAAYDRKLRRDMQLALDDVRIPSHQ